MNKEIIKKSFFAGLFSFITIFALTLLTYKTEYGLFLIASFGSSMVLLYGYPESPFAQPKNIFFGHVLTSVVGIFFLYFVPMPIYIIIPLAVGFGVVIMIIGSVSFEYLINPIILGTLIILIFGVVLNRLILKKKYPL